MIDPTDIALAEQREGNAETLPTPTGGPDATPPTGDVQSAAPVRMHAVFAYDVAVGAEQAVRANDVPDYWSVSMSLAATGAASVWPYEQASGPPIRLEPGGEAILGGLSQSMYIRNTGPIIAKLTIIAVRGFAGIRTRWGT